MVKDYILAMDCDNAEDMWDAVEWDREAAVLAAEVAAAQAGGDAVPAPVVDPADEYNALPVGNAAQRKLKQQHAKAFAYIRRSLSPPIFEKTLGHRTNVPKLLRMLKNCWSDNTTQDRDRMRTQFDSMRLSDFSDMDAFITAFNNHVRVMRNHDMGLVARDEDVLFAFNKALPSAWNLQKEVSSAASHGLNQAQNYYLKAAVKDESLPGSTKIAQKPDSVHFQSSSEQKTRPTCHNYAKTGKCRFGVKCRHTHTELPSQSSRKEQGERAKISCNYCKKLGHKERACFKKRNDEKKAASPDAANATQDHAKGQDKAGEASSSHYAASVSIDGVAYTTEECHVDMAGAKALRSAVGGNHFPPTVTGTLLMV